MCLQARRGAENRGRTPTIEALEIDTEIPVIGNPALLHKPPVIWYKG
jgi:hypothetical protein